MAWRNPALLVGSLGFYSIDGGYVTSVLLFSIFFNQIIGLAIHRVPPSSGRLSLVWFGVLANVAPLIYFKYWRFLLHIGHDALLPAGIQVMLSEGHVVLPAGISFFTFQGLSYLVDIYRREVVPAAYVVDFGMYHTLFPQLIAGPIVRYIEVEDRIRHRPVYLDDVEAGIIRFCWGLGKKIVVADSMGSLADHMFALPADQLTGSGAWIGALGYTLQIFFDFSGYSDMAIGLGRMLGFRFPENFAQPYRSLSITEFWRRWHMTLSRWFRDYVYLPLGGNRKGPVRTYINLFAVFLLCGLWHGAAYTFVVWGAYHGVLLVIERIVGRGATRAPPLPDVVRWALTLLLIVVGWVIFRAASLDEAATMLKAMAGFGARVSNRNILAFVTADKITFFVIGAAISLSPTLSWIVDLPRQAETLLLASARRGLALGLFVYSVILIAANGFNPFIYFRF